MEEKEEKIKKLTERIWKKMNATVGRKGDPINL